MQNTKIEWADSTFNPWIGCTKVVFGDKIADQMCVHCYADDMDRRRFSKTLGGATKENPIRHWGKGKPRYRTSLDNWKEPVRWNKKVHRQCRLCGEQWSGGDGYCPKCEKNECDWVRPRVFPSLMDWLDEEVPIEWLADFLKLIHDTPNLDWLLLTKRPENWRKRIEAAWKALPSGADHYNMLRDWLRGEPPKNVWIGTSVGTQKSVDIRIPEFLKIPAVVHFLSCEPLLEEIDIERWMHRTQGYSNPDPNYQCPHCGQTGWGEYFTTKTGGGDADCECNFCHKSVESSIITIGSIDWVICGGESGDFARPMHPDWARALRDECVEAGVPFFFKQWGEWAPFDCGYDVCEDRRYQSGDMDQLYVHPVAGAYRLHPGADDYKEMSQRRGVAMNRVGKAYAGRLLDGREWNEMPRNYATT